MNPCNYVLKRDEEGKALERCNAPSYCEHRSKPIKIERESALEDLKTSDKVFIKEYEFGKYPHCRIHGAMLKVNPNPPIWRCSTVSYCGVGVIYP